MNAIRWWMGALLLALVGAAQAQVTRYDATDFPGNDLGDIVGRARSFDECAQRCLADGRCGAFTYNLSNRVCIPKSAAGDADRNPRAVSGVVMRREAGPGFGPGPGPGYGPGRGNGITRYDATDLPNGDIDDLVGRARSYDDCARRCLADGRCNAFTFNLNNANCIPKSAAGEPQRNSRAVSGIVVRGGYGPGATSCSADGAGSCPGCSVTCQAPQRAVCAPAVEGEGGPCLRNSLCRCGP